jgi:hypothetical protein
MVKDEHMSDMSQDRCLQCLVEDIEFLKREFQQLADTVWTMEQHTEHRHAKWSRPE